MHLNYIFSCNRKQVPSTNLIYAQSGREVDIVLDVRRRAASDRSSDVAQQRLHVPDSNEIKINTNDKL